MPYLSFDGPDGDDPPFLVAGAFYYIFNVIVDYLMGRVEKRLDYYR